MLAQKLLSGGGEEKIYVDDVFQVTTYTAPGTSLTLTTGINLSGKGGLSWFKVRNTTYDHLLIQANVGGSAGVQLSSNNTQSSGYNNASVTFSSTGINLPSGDPGLVNEASTSRPYVVTSFRNAPNFYGHQVVVKSSGSNATVSFPEHTAGLGMVRVKRTDATGSWYVWHRSLSAGKLLIGETTAAEATLGHITVSGTTVTLVNGVIADGTYLVEAFAHDTSTDGIIQCVSFTTDGSGNATVNLGWEPQFSTVKMSSTSGGGWYIVDEMRGNPTSNGTVSNQKWLFANTSDAESSNYGVAHPTSTGFVAKSMTANQTFIYLAIRRPNKPPTSGTQVYNAIARTGTGAAATVTGVGFAPDLVVSQRRDSTGGGGSRLFDRLRGAGNLLWPYNTNAEATYSDSLTSFNMDGISIGADSNGILNINAATYAPHFFKRAPGVFDQVCYTGTGANPSSFAHSLGVEPTLIIIKPRNANTDWYVYSRPTNFNTYGVLNSTAAFSGGGIWAFTYPTATLFTLSDAGGVNLAGGNFTAYLFATKAGISKVGSYTGNGGTQTINCGFTTGARFVLIKRTDSTGDWYVWSSTTGIVAGNDPHLSLNTTAAEVTTDDSIDPDSSGFIVNQLAATNINVNAASYIFLAFA